MSESPDDSWLLLVTARAPSNIAVIKYWGKRDEDLILPLNGSISITLDPQHLSATTTVACSPKFTTNRLWLNSKEVSFQGPRYERCLQALRSRARDVSREVSRGGKVQLVKVSKEQWQQLQFHVVSENNFPTAAGLASSAAGFACLVFALAQLMGVEEAYPGELSTIARMGSGSACRSLDSGFVRWSAGTEADGSDSLATQVVDHTYWPGIVVFVLVVSQRQKETSSTAGMKESVRTSPLLLHRAKEVVPGRMLQMEEVIRNRDFETFATLTCADSNSFHATCLDTSPPIFYLNDTSKRIIDTVERWNREAGRKKAAYTFDAGPNAVLFVEESNAADLFSLILQKFPPPQDVPLSEFVRGDLERVKAFSTAEGPSKVEAEANQSGSKESALEYIICTRGGKGAHVVSWDESGSLLDVATSAPKL